MSSLRSQSQPPRERPFDGLSPDCVIDAVESLGFRSDGRVNALGSYENRVYQVGIEDGPPLVAKFYRPGRWSDVAIQEEHDFSRELAIADVPVVAPLEHHTQTLFRHQAFRFALFPRRGGRWPELATSDEREWMGRFLGRMHAIGARRPFVHRPALSIDLFGHGSVAYLLDHDFVPEYLVDRFVSLTAEALDRIEAAFDAVGRLRTIRLHGDCHRGNVLWTDAGPHFVDLDDCMSGPAIQDLWMLVAGTSEEIAEQMRDLLGGYRRFAEFDTRELALIEPLRTLRLLHYNAWLARRWQDPAFPLAFPWFGDARHWESVTQSLNEQIERLDAVSA